MGLRVGGRNEGALCVALPCKGRAAGALPQLHPRCGRSLCAGDGDEHSVPVRPCRRGRGRAGRGGGVRPSPSAAAPQHTPDPPPSPGRTVHQMTEPPIPPLCCGMQMNTPTPTPKGNHAPGPMPDLSTGMPRGLVGKLSLAPAPPWIFGASDGPCVTWGGRPLHLAPRSLCGGRPSDDRGIDRQPRCTARPAAAAHHSKSFEKK